MITYDTLINSGKMQVYLSTFWPELFNKLYKLLYYLTLLRCASESREVVRAGSSITLIARCRIVPRVARECKAWWLPLLTDVNRFRDKDKFEPCNGWQAGAAWNIAWMNKKSLSLAADFVKEENVHSKRYQMRLRHPLWSDCHTHLRRS